ncbi:ABC-type phosphate/phosphonate transport system, substrate-binding protein [Duganella sp. CF517]|uniref:phosphate/phosphite/phosphonate ABC transporter substrate-binding protein n=1 Tax=Duganella sp. CF517 TaxID=1881038 RepID=UPI0008CB46D1|nr:PhnD/SsuA/transferrin family substrate-binding protein [Duganella sp. CF517]SEN18717.1 ABC-type phosphate/phosphonate transport system, substrate-binding protein [Duganella sp. CF517]
MTWIAALPMYNVSERLGRAYEDFLVALAQEAGQEVSPQSPSDLPAFWRRRDLLLSQTCGYPYMTRLRGEVTLVATPCYDFAGCSGSDYSSVIVVREGAGVDVLADAAGLVAVVNDVNSNSGMNVLRHAVAPLAQDGRFFGKVIQSGSHAASVRMVRQGAADIAAVDCVTWGYLAREDPEASIGLKALRYSASSPGLPLIAGAAVEQELVLRLRGALLRPGARLRELMDVLSIRGFEYRDDADYALILQIQTEAEAAGYPGLA